MGRRAFLHVCLVAVSIGTGAGAQDLEPSRFYLKGFGGAEFPKGFDGSELSRVVSHGPFNESYRFDYDTGAVLGAAIGFLASPRVAAELEYAYRRSYATATGASTELDSEPTRNEWTFDERVTVQSGMVNVLYRFDGLGPQGRATPYTGADVGIASLDVRGTGRADPAFAWQVTGGAAYAIDEHWSLSGELRWFSTEGGTSLRRSRGRT